MKSLVFCSLMLLGSSALAAPLDFEALAAEASQLAENGDASTASAKFEALAAELAVRWPDHPSIDASLFRAAELAGADVARSTQLLERIIERARASKECLEAVRIRLRSQRSALGPKGELLYAHGLFRRFESGDVAAEALFRSGQILAADLGDLEAAVKPLEKLVSSMPVHTRAIDARLLLAELQHRLGQSERAIEELRKVASSSVAGSRSEDASLGVGSLLAELGRKEEALAAFLTFADQHPASLVLDRALHEGAKLAQELGQAQRAKQIRARLSRERPDSPYLPRR